MNNYLIKIIHPEWGEQGNIPGQGSNAWEALENAVGNGSNGIFGQVNYAYVKNIETGFTVKIEFMHD